MSNLYDVVQAKVSTAINELRYGDHTMHQVVLTSSDTGPLPIQTVLHWVHDLIPHDMVLYRSWDEEEGSVLNLAIQKVDDVPANEADWKIRAIRAEEKIAKVRDALESLEDSGEGLTPTDSLRLYLDVSRAVRR